MQLNSVPFIYIYIYTYILDRRRTGQKRAKYVEQRKTEAAGSVDLVSGGGGWWSCAEQTNNPLGGFVSSVPRFT